jgi:hypothetical protein
MGNFQDRGLQRDAGAKEFVFGLHFNVSGEQKGDLPIIQPANDRRVVDVPVRIGST